MLEKAIREIERQSGFLEEIKTSSSTIKNGADKILSRVETMRAVFVKQIKALDTQASLLRKACAAVVQTLPLTSARGAPADLQLRLEPAGSGPIYAGEIPRLLFEDALSLSET